MSKEHHRADKGMVVLIGHAAEGFRTGCGVPSKDMELCPRCVAQEYAKRTHGSEQQQQLDMRD